MTVTNTRRTVLKVAAVLGGSTVVGAGVGAAQDESDDGGDSDFAAAVDGLFDLTLDDDGWYTVEPGTQSEDADRTEAGNQTQEGDEAEETNPTLELEDGGVYVIRWTNELEPGEDVTDEADGNETEGEPQDGIQRRPTELVVLGEDDEEIVRSDETEREGSAAVVFVATGSLATYRDEATGAEGEIEVQGSEDGDDENGDDEEAGGDGTTGEGGDDTADENFRASLRGVVAGPSPEERPSRLHRRRVGRFRFRHT